MPPNIRIGLALGSGSARGLAHIGVILTQVQRALGVTAYQAMSHKIDNLSVTRLQHTEGNWSAALINHCP